MNATVKSIDGIAPGTTKNELLTVMLDDGTEKRVSANVNDFGTFEIGQTVELKIVSGGRFKNITTVRHI